MNIKKTRLINQTRFKFKFYYLAFGNSTALAAALANAS